MENVIKHEEQILEEFNEIFTDLLTCLKEIEIDNKVGIVNKIKDINDSIIDIKSSINTLLININENKIIKKEIDRKNSDKFWKREFTNLFPQTFLNNMYLNDDVLDSDID